MTDTIDSSGINGAQFSSEPHFQGSAPVAEIMHAVHSATTNAGYSYQELRNGGDRVPLVVDGRVLPVLPVLWLFMNAASRAERRSLG